MHVGAPPQSGLTLELVANVSYRYEFPGDVAMAIGRDKPAVIAEAMIHELAHAAVFGMSAYPLQSLTERVARRFRKYERPKISRPADRAECVALAVERIVFEALDWKIDHKLLLTLAQEDMRAMTIEEAEREVEAAMTERNANRAGQVIAWLYQITGATPAS